MKKIFFIAFAVMFVVFISSNTTFAESNTSKKIAVLFSKTSEDYANITRPGGTYNGKTIAPKVDYSSIKDKELKLFHLYKQQGFNVTAIDENALNNLTTLNQYDAVVFTNTVLMTHSQRENVKAYIRDGGGAIFAFATARNEASVFPKAGQMDLTPLIHYTKTWVFEWDNLTEVFQSRFVDDITLKNFTVKNNATTHTILTNTYKELGKNSIQLTNNRLNGDWIEMIVPWRNSVAPLLVYGTYSYADKPIMAKNSVGAAYAFEYGRGRIVYTGFKIYDFINVNAEAAWEDSSSGLAYDGTTGGKDASVFLKHSLNWVAENHNVNKARNYNVSITLSDIKGSLRNSKNDFIIYSDITVKNNGNVPVRGSFKFEVINVNGKVIGTSKTIYLPGLSPETSTNNADNKNMSTHFEDGINISLPYSLPLGTYTLRATFTEGRQDRKGQAEKLATVADLKAFSRIKGSIYPQVKNASFFPDVTTKNAAYNDIKNLYSLGIIKGSNGKFNPQGNLTRIQSTEMILRSLGISASASATMNATDLNKGDYGYAILATGIRYGIISLENGKINAHQPMKRSDMATAIVNGFKLQGTTEHTFNDIPTTHANYKSIQTLYALSVTTGFTTDNTFRPNNTVTRQQFSSFINRALKANSK